MSSPSSAARVHFSGPRLGKAPRGAHRFEGSGCSHPDRIGVACVGDWLMGDMYLDIEQTQSRVN